MTGKNLLRKVLATACAAALGMSFATWGAPSAHAATVTKAVKMSCRTNGAPLKYNVTRPSTAQVVVTTPENVQAGQNAVIRVQYSIPEGCPGKESIATMKEMKDIVLRYTLDDPSAFVTARAIGIGKKMTKPAAVSLVGGKMIVMSGMDVPVNGEHTYWAPPPLEITLKAPTQGTVLKTIHMSVEGASGEFNNPANAVTMKTVTEGAILGELTIQLNCQVLSGAETYATIPVVGGGKPNAAPAAPCAPGKQNPGPNKPGVAPGKNGPGATQNNGNATLGGPGASISTDANGLQCVDEDIYAEEFEGGGTPGWLVAVIVIICLAAAGGVGYGIYYGVKNRKEKQKS